MIDKPLYENPLAGGGTLDRLSNIVRRGLNFRQEGDMGRYIADNDPGGIAAGYSNLEDYLAAGNQMPQLPNREPLKAFENPALANSIIGNGIYDMNTSGMLLPGAPGTSTLNVTPPSVPVSEQTPLPGIIDPNAEAQKKANEEFLKTADEYQKGFRESEFYKPGGAMTADVAEFIYKSPTGEDITMKGSSSGIGQFGSYLDSIGKGDLLQRVGGSFSQDLVNPDDPLAGAKQGLFPIKNEKGEDIGGIENTAIATVQDPLGGNYTKSVQPIVTGPDMFEIATQQTPSENNFFETTGQYLTGPDESNDIIETLKNIEQGIASLGGNFGQNFNMNQSSNYGDFDNFGIGSFFPPYGGMYG